MLPVEPTANEQERYPWTREFTITAPPGVPEEDCGDLKALVGHDPQSSTIEFAAPYIISFWKPSEEELEILNNGGHIELVVWNNQMSPIAMNAVPS